MPVPKKQARQLKEVKSEGPQQSAVNISQHQVSEDTEASRVKQKYYTVQFWCQVKAATHC